MVRATPGSVFEGHSWQYFRKYVVPRMERGSLAEKPAF